MTREEILAQIDRSWANFTEAIAGLPADRLGEPGVSGHWSAKDVIGHVAFWDRFSAEQARRQLSGEPEPEGMNDWQALNDRDHAAKADWDASRILSELDAAHAEILTAYRALPTLDPDHVKEDWEHYDEHAAEIHAWRERAGV
ncbi:MAG TPA: DinB family protein [Thermomicrobiales bacterium]|nr:DinB family protein [Thermomicrobiales bacterium]